MAVSKNIRKNVSRTNKSKQQHFSHPAGNERMLTKQRSGNSPPAVGLNFTEVAGKVVAYVNMFSDPPEWQSLEIQFTDGTLLHFEFPAVYTCIKPKYMEVRHGDLEMIRDYGALRTEEERKTR